MVITGVNHEAEKDSPAKNRRTIDREGLVADRLRRATDWRAEVILAI